MIQYFMTEHKLFVLKELQNKSLKTFKIMSLNQNQLSKNFQMKLKQLTTNKKFK